jgi:hypothetical protein
MSVITGLPGFEKPARANKSGPHGKKRNLDEKKKNRYSVEGIHTKCGGGRLKFSSFYSGKSQI